ncbi:MAG: PIN domain-containing protein [Bacteroidota bacterium]|nr:PIN domain-containing protein [Flavisolibacter sp.]MDQ3845831.1 PIN domain-containing protein [Bacteroidota bacterium]
MVTLSYILHSCKVKNTTDSLGNIGEVYYMIARKSTQKAAETALDALLKFPLSIVEADLKLSLEAAKLKAKYALSYADAFAAALTIREKAVLLTGDNEFET